MKKISLMIMLLVSLFILNVKADMGPPSIISYKAMITNKDGAVCYENDTNNKMVKKGDIIVPYKTIFQIYDDVMNGYIYARNDNYECYVKSSDISAVDHNFDLNNKEIDSITPIKAIILADGLNLRRGPATSYAKVTTIPKNTVVTLTKRAGTFWYYTEYNGKSGWLTAMNHYIGFDANKVLINDQMTEIYDRSGKVLGKIPANTEITDYVEVEYNPYNNGNYSYYVVYKGIKGFIKNILFKTDGDGVINLIKEVQINDNNGKPIKKLMANQELTYTMIKTEEYDNYFYFKDKGYGAYIPFDAYEDVKKVNIKIKDHGYLGEGIFGEEKTKVIEDTKQEEVHEEKKEEKGLSFSKSELIIIGLLAGILLALTALVLIKLVNSKKNANVVPERKVMEENKNIVKEEDKIEDNANADNEVNNENKDDEE